MDNETLWVYVGGHIFVDGIPARDLCAPDWERLTIDERSAVENSGLYRRAKQGVKPDSAETSKVTTESLETSDATPLEEEIDNEKTGAPKHGRPWKNAREVKE